jgi:hypothetical protein
MATKTYRDAVSGASVPDTFLDEDNPATAQDTASDSYRVGNFYAIKSGDTKYRGLLHFDVSDLPAGATINSATLDLNILVADTAATAAEVRRVTQASWVEAEATWNSYSTGNSWTSAGGDYTATGEVAWNHATATGSKTISGLGALVQDALDSRSGQLHIILMSDAAEADTGNTHQNRFRSGEGTTESERPLLTVNYSPLASVATTDDRRGVFRGVGRGVLRGAV